MLSNSLLLTSRNSMETSATPGCLSLYLKKWSDWHLKLKCPKKRKKNISPNSLSREIITFDPPPPLFRWLGIALRRPAVMRYLYLPIGANAFYNAGYSTEVQRERSPSRSHSREKEYPHATSRTTDEVTKGMLVRAGLDSQTRATS